MRPCGFGHRKRHRREPNQPPGFGYRPERRGPKREPGAARGRRRRHARGWRDAGRQWRSGRRPGQRRGRRRNGRTPGAGWGRNGIRRGPRGERQFHRTFTFCRQRQKPGDVKLNPSRSKWGSATGSTTEILEGLEEGAQVATGMLTTDATASQGAGQIRLGVAASAGSKDRGCSWATLMG